MLILAVRFCLFSLKGFAYFGCRVLLILVVGVCEYQFIKSISIFYKYSRVKISSFYNKFKFKIKNNTALEFVYKLNKTILGIGICRFQTFSIQKISI